MRNPLSSLGLVLSLVALPALAQEERSFADRFLYGGEITGNFSPKDRGYFNELVYRRNLLRLVRLNLAVEFQASDQLAILTEIRTDNLDVPEPYALYVRFRPWRERAIDIQAGLVPPVFGAFARRRYELDNPLIGTPLTYQYPSTTRPDAAPAELSEVLDQRGWGTRVSYPIGEQEILAGLPMMNPLQWDTGVQVLFGGSRAELGVALTQGTISNPRVKDDNSGKQIAARLALRPAFGFILGVSGARGAYLSEDVSSITGESGHQTAFGVDVELAKSYFVLRGEAIWSQWDAPTLATGALGGLGFYVEASYKVTPGFYVAARADHIRFGDVDSGAGTTTWDASITRFELGIGYYFHRHVLGKAVYQYNERDAGPLTVRGIPAVQLLFWF